MTIFFLPDELAVAGFPQHRLVVEIEVKILFAHETVDALRRFRNIQIEKCQAFIHAYDRFAEHLNQEVQRLYTQLFDTSEWN